MESDAERIGSLGVPHGFQMARVMSVVQSSFLFDAGSSSAGGYGIGLF